MDEMKASDADRERVVSALQEQVGAGRLTLEEFEERSNVAYTARTIGELRKLTRDLPVEPFPEPVRPFAGGPFGGGPGGWSAGGWSAPYQQAAQQAQRARQALPMRRLNPLVLIPLALVAIVVAGDIIGAVFWTGRLLFPLIIIAFVAMRIAGISRRRGGWRGRGGWR
ncbi:MAG TPA: DUF1707 domain-containing protein [Pseudonocardiaceae bacterium]|jgi:hypothetical protein|nr:DUF1707 domain-containing protein [Pseudonocardiaceae bacterium]